MKMNSLYKYLSGLCLINGITVLQFILCISISAETWQISSYLLFKSLAHEFITSNFKFKMKGYCLIKSFAFLLFSARWYGTQTTFEFNLNIKVCKKVNKV